MNPISDSSNRSNGLPNFGCLKQALSELTPCEWKILLQVADDLTTAEIAEKFCLTPKSVENYRTRVSGKLNLQGRHKLPKFARKHADELRRYHRQQLGKLPPRNKVTLRLAIRVIENVSN